MMQHLVTRVLGQPPRPTSPTAQALADRLDRRRVQDRQTELRHQLRILDPQDDDRPNERDT